MEISPFKHGRLAMSPEAMKIAAKILAKGRPVPAIMAGLRHDAEKAGGPLRLPAPIKREAMIIGTLGSGIMPLSRELVNDVSNSGYRIIRFTHATPRFFLPEDVHASRVIWGPDQWFHAWEGETGISMMDLHAVKGSVHEKVGRYLDSSFAEDTVVMTGFRLVNLLFTSREIYENVRDGAVEAILGRKDLSDCVLVLEDVDLGARATESLRNKFAGVFGTFSAYEMERLSFGPDMPCVFGKDSYICGPEEGGINFDAGQYGDRNIKELLTDIRITFRDPDAEVKPGEDVRFDHRSTTRRERPREEIAKAIKRLRADLQNENDQPLLKTHTDRLNAVARACGYQDWQAAQGRR